ncbi:MAG TPA: hypothetical protein VD866_06670 [Urbifossiella sp.]|nr:hypothetical protein [Urbifossiella sp.]
MVLAIALQSGCAAPTKHYLTDTPDEKNIEFAKFEVAYFSFLATMTGAAAFALLGLMYVSQTTGIHRRFIQVCIIAFVLAVSMLTLGYAARNLWVMSRQPLKEWFTTLDFYVIGPLTVVTYFVGVVSLVGVVVTLRYPIDNAGKLKPAEPGAAPGPARM